MNEMVELRKGPLDGEHVTDVGTRCYVAPSRSSGGAVTWKATRWQPTPFRGIGYQVLYIHRTAFGDEWYEFYCEIEEIE